MIQTGTHPPLTTLFFPFHGTIVIELDLTFGEGQAEEHWDFIWPWSENVWEKMKHPNSSEWKVKIGIMQSSSLYLQLKFLRFWAHSFGSFISCLRSKFSLLVLIIHCASSAATSMLMDILNNIYFSCMYDFLPTAFKILRKTWLYIHINMQNRAFCHSSNYACPLLLVSLSSSVHTQESLLYSHHILIFTTANFWFRLAAAMPPKENKLTSHVQNVFLWCLVCLVVCRTGLSGLVVVLRVIAVS